MKEFIQPKANMQELKNDVSHIIEKTLTLFQTASNIFKTDDKENSYFKTAKSLKKEKQKVDNLELRMTIVAPMKAGKSTIINAIAGRDILPSRNEAMTIIPTEIHFKAQKDDFIQKQLPLHLEDNFKTEINSLLDKIKHRKLSDNERFEINKFVNISRLHSHIKKNNENIDTLIIKYDINEQLTFINDIIRIAKKINIPTSFLLSDKIKFPHVNLFLKQKKFDGTLVVIDTPGFEDANSEHVVNSQLDNTTLTFLVLDYTKFGTKEAEKLKDKILTFLTYRGTSSLYILVNKIDQRKEKKDMQKKDVINFIKNDLQISIKENRIFEISARKAYFSKRYETESKLENFSKTNEINDLVGREYFGDSWEDSMKEMATSEMINLAASKLWEKSQFDYFFDNAIELLLQKAAPETLKLSLKYCDEKLKGLEEQLKFHNKAIKKDATILRNQIESLRTEIEELETIKEKIETEKIIEKNLLEQVKIETEKIKKKININQQHFKSVNNKSVINKELHLEIIKLINSNTDNKILNLKKGTILKFSSKSSADNFNKKLQKYINSHNQFYIDKSVNAIQERIGIELKKFSKDIQLQTKHIIKKAQDRLHEEFDFKIKEPVFSNNIKPKTKKFKNPNEKEEPNYEYRRKWYFLWLFKQITFIGNTTYYHIDLAENFKINISANNETLNEFNTEITKHIKKDFKKETDNAFKTLYKFFNRYKESLESALNEQKQDEDKKKERAETITQLLTNAQITQTEIVIRNKLF